MKIIVNKIIFYDKVGLILAQNERLWHALHMQVERKKNLFFLSGERVSNA